MFEFAAIDGYWPQPLTPIPGTYKSSGQIARAMADHLHGGGDFTTAAIEGILDMVWVCGVDAGAAAVSKEGTPLSVLPDFYVQI